MRIPSATIICDWAGCFASEDDLGTIGDLLPKVRAEGWRVRRLGGQCWDLCPEHANMRARVVESMTDSGTKYGELESCE